MAPGSKLNNLTFAGSNRTWIVPVILLLSLILRWVLILRGGQYYISDETRYEVSRQAAAYLLHGQVVEALKQFTVSPEHVGFKVIGVIPALLEHIAGPSLAMPAMFFSLFSILNLYLIFLLSQHTSISTATPLYALILAAASHSLLYYSRHLFPYDMSMTFGLLALQLAFGKKQTVWRPFLCGGLSFLCFITYNGYWPLAGYAMLVYVLLAHEKFSAILPKAIFTALGFLVPLALLVIAMQWLGSDIITAYRRFSTTITQGSFNEGWSLPFAYFWYTEKLVIIILVGLSLFAISNASQPKQNSTSIWASGVLFIYLCLLIPSALPLFVVYGRLARQMLPFLVLLAAEGITHLERTGKLGYKGIIVILAITLAQAGWNFTESFKLAFPREFVAEAQARYPDFEFSSKRFAFGAPEICQNNGYAIENAKYYVDPPGKIPEVQGQLLMSAPHPSTFKPYQYDGDLPATRRAFDRLRLQMKFYKVDEQFMAESNPEWTEMKDCWINEK